MPEHPDDALCHPVAISMDEEGRARRLLTTNRWVTGELWGAARDAVRMIDLFRIERARPSRPADRWVTAMLALFRPQIEALLKKRDICVALYRRHHPGAGVHEARALEVTSAVDISVEAQIAAVETARRLGQALHRSLPIRKGGVADAIRA